MQHNIKNQGKPIVTIGLFQFNVRISLQMFCGWGDGVGDEETGSIVVFLVSKLLLERTIRLEITTFKWQLHIYIKT
jgi:hypothetical protein